MVLADVSVAQLDTLLITSEQLPIVRDVIHGAPDLLIEILSPGTRDRDRTPERHLYARQGVRELWLVDPVERTVAVFRLDPSSETPSRIFAERDTLTSDVLPSFHLPLQPVWA